MLQDKWVKLLVQFCLSTILFVAFGSFRQNGLTFKMTHGSSLKVFKTTIQENNTSSLSIGHFKLSQLSDSVIFLVTTTSSIHLVAAG